MKVNIFWNKLCFLSALYEVSICSIEMIFMLEVIRCYSCSSQLLYQMPFTFFVLCHHFTEKERKKRLDAICVIVNGDALSCR